MADIELTCQLFKDVVENSPEFVVEVNTQDYILGLQEKIYEEVKKSNNNFLELDSNDLKLWKVEIDNGDNGAFSGLILPNDDAKKLSKLKEKVADYWNDEERRPKEGHTHIIIDSPILKKDAELRNKERQIQDKERQIQDKDERDLDVCIM